MIKDAGPLSIGMACSFVRQSANGLQHAHDQGLIHRDIKPSNLLVTALQKSQTEPGGVVKILDMGLARAAVTGETESDISALTQAGTVIGTPDFMSPEQAKNSSTVDARSDLYSLGCTLYYLLTGQAPFPQGSTLEKLLQHQMDAPPQIQLKRQDVPHEVAGIVHKLLAKRPDDRFQSGSALATALETWSGIDPNGQSATGRRSGRLEVVPQALPVANSNSEHSLDGKTQGDPFDFDAMETHSAPAPSVRTARITEEKIDPGPPEKRNSLIWWFMGVGGGMLMLVIGFLIARGLDKKTPPAPKPDETPIVKEEPKKETTPPKKELPKNKLELDRLDAYLPPDTAAAIVINVPQVVKPGPFTNKVLPRLEPILARASESRNSFEASSGSSLESRRATALRSSFFKARFNWRPRSGAGRPSGESGSLRRNRRMESTRCSRFASMRVILRLIWRCSISGRPRSPSRQVGNASAN